MNKKRNVPISVKDVLALQEERKEFEKEHTSKIQALLKKNKSRFNSGDYVWVVKDKIKLVAKNAYEIDEKRKKLKQKGKVIYIVDHSKPDDVGVM